MLIGKLQNGDLVQIIKTAESVLFSEETGWILIVTDFEKPLHRQQGIKWIPATTEFCWVRELFLDNDPA